MAAHRDALAAALAKIQALESALEEARSSAGPSMTYGDLDGERARLELLLSAAHAERRVAEDRAEHAERELAALREAREREIRAAGEREVEARSRREALVGLAPLDEHNRSQRPLSLSEAEPAGVLCPACATKREQVELVLGRMRVAFGGVSFAHVLCPRCGHLGVKRER